jgi:hypothetical protein
MRLRFPDTGSLPHPVGWEGLKAKRRESLSREKSECSRLKGSKSRAVKLRILKRFSFGSPYNKWESLWQNIKILKILKEKNIEIIGADIVELAPELDHSKSSTVFTGKVLREMLICMGS